MQLQQLEEYVRLLADWNERMNLTAIVREDEVWEKHIYDSVLFFVPLEAAIARVADVGSGGGLPGVVLQILRPGWTVDLIESQHKKAAFLEVVRQTLGLPGQVVCARAEQLGCKGGYREAYDVVTVRAVAALREVAELGLPLLRIGGILVASKGPRVREELLQEDGFAASLGGGLWRVSEERLPESGAYRALVHVEKKRATDARWPRPTAQIKRGKIRHTQGNMSKPSKP